MTAFAMPEPAPLIRVLLALTASRDAVAELTQDRLQVRLGLTWHTEIPRSSIRSATRVDRSTLGIGAHGRRGRWLVNTARRGLVRLELEPAATASCLGLRHTLTELTVSLADPEAFLQELGFSNAV